MTIETVFYALSISLDLFWSAQKKDEFILLQTNLFTFELVCAGLFSAYSRTSHAFPCDVYYIEN